MKSEIKAPILDLTASEETANFTQHNCDDQSCPQTYRS